MQLNDSKSFKLKIENYSGPLDILLDLAKSQKVDLNKISVTELANQFHSFIQNAENLNLDLASEYLLMATWLTYLKSKLLLPENEEEQFKALEVAAKLKIQLKKLELIRLLSDQMLKKKRLGIDIFSRGIKGGIRSIYSTNYKVTLYELLKSYSNVVVKKDFQRINIPRLPVFTAEEGIKRIKSLFDTLIDWRDITKLIPYQLMSSKNLVRTGLAGMFTASLELAKEGNISIKQTKLFENIFIKKN